MEFFTELEAILKTEKIDDKIERFKRFYTCYHDNTLSIHHDTTPEIFTVPSFATICNIVDAKTMPQRT